MLQRIKEFLYSEKGQGIVEYALILAFVVAIAAVALSSDSGLGKAIKDRFSNTEKQVAPSTTTTTPATNTQTDS